MTQRLSKKKNQLPKRTTEYSLHVAFMLIRNVVHKTIADNIEKAVGN